MLLNQAEEDQLQAGTEVPAVLVQRGDDGSIRAVPGTAPLRKPGPRELLIRPAFVGICGTDIEILHGRMPETFHINYPHVMGHEWSGTVEEVGSAVTGFQPGDRVLGHGHLGGNDWFGVTHDGAAAEQFTVAADMCFHVPDGVDLVTAAIIEPFACVLNGFKKIGGISAGDTVHVYGLGAIGLAGLLQSVTAGARVVALDPSPARRDLALQLGAAAAIDPTTTADIPAAAEALTGRPLADVVLEASGNPVAQANALESADEGGRVLLMGVSRPRPVPALLGLVQQRGLTVSSSTGAPVDIWPAAIRYIDQAKIDLGRIVSGIRSFSDCVEAIEAAQDSGREIKVMLVPDGSPNLPAAQTPTNREHALTEEGQK